jgi:hypothetical protein
MQIAWGRPCGKGHIAGIVGYGLLALLGLAVAAVGRLGWLRGHSLWAITAQTGLALVVMIPIMWVELILTAAYHGCFAGD